MFSDDDRGGPRAFFLKQAFCHFLAAFLSCIDCTRKPKTVLRFPAHALQILLNLQPQICATGADGEHIVNFDCGFR